MCRSATIDSQILMTATWKQASNFVLSVSAKTNRLKPSQRIPAMSLPTLLPELRNLYLGSLIAIIAFRALAAKIGPFDRVIASRALVADYRQQGGLLCWLPMG